MQHKLLEAKATTTDLGEFTAIAAAYSLDRTNERILPGAFKETIVRWQESGKKIPLHWDHEGDASSIIGYVDPSSVKETEDGLQVSGQLDLKDSEKAREAWRVMKQDSVGLSFGYMVTDSSESEDGIRELKTLDLFEISITPAPANPDTRFLSLKSVKDMASMAARMTAMAEEMRSDTPPSAEEMARRMRSMADEMAAMRASATETSKETEHSTEIEDRKDEEPSPAKSSRQDPLRDETERLWFATAVGKFRRRGSDAHTESAAP